jgi:hypothetical protein
MLPARGGRHTPAAEQHGGARAHPQLSSEIVPEIVEYPDSGKFHALSAQGEMLFRTRYGERVEYWDGES